jgi:nascent polypeptide-associated complex subunit alpha
MIPGMNPREMQKAMKRLGIKQEEINATQVVIRTNGPTLVINNPQVSKVNMMGQETYQVVGSAEEVEEMDGNEISADDIKTVVEQAGCLEEQAKTALEEAEGDIAQAILKITEKES